MHRKEQAIRVIDQGDEAELDTELASSVIQGVHLDGPNAGLIGNVLRPAERVDQEQRAESLPLHRSVHGQPSRSITATSIFGSPFAWSGGRAS